jgi:O-antigen/teichoic acid export membrane protein
MFSGYFSCCLYELAAAQFSAESDRSFAGQLMSTSFQWACFLAVAVALLIVVLDDIFADNLDHH